MSRGVLFTDVKFAGQSPENPHSIYLHCPLDALGLIPRFYWPRFLHLRCFFIYFKTVNAKNRTLTMSGNELCLRLDTSFPGIWGTIFAFSNHR